jgi:hypothetical protein
MKNLSLSLRIVLPVVAIASSAVAFNGYLSYAKFEKHLSQLELSRMRFSVDDIKNNLETGLRLGLPIRALSNAQEIVTSSAQKERDVLSIEVIDHEGKPAFRGGSLVPDKAYPRGWQSTVLRRQRPMETMTADAFLLLIPLVGMTEDSSGALLVRYSREVHDRTMQGVLRGLLPLNITAIALSVIVGMVGVFMLMRSALRRIRGVEEYVGAVVEGKTPPVARLPELDGAIGAAREVVRIAGTSLHQSPASTT